MPIGARLARGNSRDLQIVYPIRNSRGSPGFGLGLPNVLLELLDRVDRKRNCRPNPVVHVRGVTSLHTGLRDVGEQSADCAQLLSCEFRVIFAESAVQL